MHWLVIIILACLALTVLKAFAGVLLLALLLALLWAICFRTRQLLLFMALLVFASLLQEYGLPILIAASILGFIALVRRPVNHSPAAADAPKLLSDQRTHPRCDIDATDPD